MLSFRLESCHNPCVYVSSLKMCILLGEVTGRVEVGERTLTWGVLMVGRGMQSTIYNGGWGGHLPLGVAQQLIPFLKNISISIPRNCLSPILHSLSEGMKWPLFPLQTLKGQSQ